MSWLPDKVVERLRHVVDAPSVEESGYRLIERLGQGGMGTVWLAEDAKLERRVALKILDLPDASGELERRLLREAKVLARLEHPGIVPVHDVSRFADGRLFYTMKLVQGARLDEHVRGVTARSDRLRIFLRICEPVAFAHAHGVVHRDLKPANIMIGPFGEVLVMDWGVAHVGEDPERAIVGTPGYMAPEQAGGASPVDARADVYALGVILRELTVDRSGAAAPKPVQAIVAKATAPAAFDRYPGVLELSGDVSRTLDGLSVSAYAEPLHERIARFVTRHALAVMLVLAYIVVRLLINLFFRP